jgi:hypothetical protein
MHIRMLYRFGVPHLGQVVGEGRRRRCAASSCGRRQWCGTPVPTWRRTCRWDPRGQPRWCADQPGPPSHHSARGWLVSQATPATILRRRRSGRRGRLHPGVDAPRLRSAPARRARPARYPGPARHTPGVAAVIRAVDRHRAVAGGRRQSCSRRGGRGSRGSHRSRQERTTCRPFLAPAAVKEYKPSLVPARTVMFSSLQPPCRLASLVHSADMRTLFCTCSISPRKCPRQEVFLISL